MNEKTLSVSTDDIRKGAEIAGGVLALLGNPAERNVVDAGELCGVIVALNMSLAKLLNVNPETACAELGRFAAQLLAADEATDPTQFNCKQCGGRIPPEHRKHKRQMCGGAKCVKPEEMPS